MLHVPGGASKTWDETPIHDCEEGALGLHGGVRGLIEDASHLPVASVSFTSRRYTGWRSAHAPKARNWSGVARKRWSAGAASVAGSVSPSASACSMRRALVPSKSETRLDSAKGLTFSGRLQPLGARFMTEAEDRGDVTVESRSANRRYSSFHAPFDHTCGHGSPRAAA